jgi:FkbM family methyltransferase
MSMVRSLRFIANHPLNQGRKLRSLVRYAKWQVGSRLVGGVVVHDWVSGSRFMARAGETGLTGNIYTGLHEFSDMGYILHALRSSDLFVDVGANAGSYTLLACAAVGARGHAFEPAPDTYRRLIDNVRLNGLEDRVVCHNAGVGGSEGVVRFTSGMDTISHVSAHGEDGNNIIEVPMCTLDTAVAMEEPTALKIDVEGFEAAVIAGARNTLAKPSLHSVVLELNGSGSRYGFDEAEVLKAMLDFGFRSYAYDPFRRSLRDLGGKNMASGNTLFIRDLEWVTERVSTASPRRIFDKDI